MLAGIEAGLIDLGKTSLEVVQDDQHYAARVALLTNTIMYAEPTTPAELREFRKCPQN